MFKHHFVHHGNEDLVLKIRGKGRRVYKGYMCALCGLVCYLFPIIMSQISEYPAFVSNHTSQIKSFPFRFIARRGCMWVACSEVRPENDRMVSG